MNNYNKRSLNTEVVLTKYKRERERERGEEKKRKRKKLLFLFWLYSANLPCPVLQGSSYEQLWVVD